jgi:hypothetical protein
MKIKKADGNVEEFRSQKLISSLRRSGASGSEIRDIVRTIESELTEGDTTQKIYRRAFELLRNSNDPIAAKYSLRRAIFDLGPTGFPFEDFLGRIFEAEGYRTKQRLTLKGKCATHEIDVAGYSPSHSFVAEAKFHARPGVKSDLQVAMYSYARFLDLQSARVCKDDVCGIVSLYVITNTKFTLAATKYAECAGINLLSWNYPKNDSLQQKIEKHGLYPITVLTHLSASQKQALLREGIILCTDIVQKPHVLHSLHLSNKKFDAVLKESVSLCGSK